MNLGEAQARITLDISDLMAKSGQAQGTLQQLDGAVGRTGTGFTKFGNAMLGIGTALIAPMGIGLNAAADLEQAIANINASLGGLPEGQLDALADEMQRVGMESKFSAVEVAAVADELAKAGFAFEEIVGGGMTEAVVDLSQATGSDLMTSVDGITAAMNLWNEAVVDTEIALTDASTAADIFTIAANESSASVQDIIAGVRNFGPMAAAIGVGFDETAAAIAFFTTNGLKAADSGVSLTRGIEDLMRVSQESPEILDQFGISLFNLDGSFVGLPALFDQLNAAFGDLSPEARQAGLSLLFGAESMDVMTLAALNGGGPMMEILGLMDETGVAAEQSALRMDTLNGKWEQLKEGVTSLLADLVSGLLPGLKGLVDGLIGVVDALDRIPGPIKTAIGAFAGLLAGIAAVVQAMRLFRAVNGLMGIAGAAGGGGFLGISLAPLLALAAGIGAVAAAIRFNLFGIRDAIGIFMDSWRLLAQVSDDNAVTRFFYALANALRSFDVGLLDTIADKLDWAGGVIEDFLDGFGDAKELLFGDSKKDKKAAKETAGAVGLMTSATEKLNDAYGEGATWQGQARKTIQRLIDPTGELAEETEGLADNATAWGDAAARSQYPTSTFGRAIATVGEGLRRAGFDGAAEMFTDLGFAVDDLSTNFQFFRDMGLNPVQAGVLALGTTFPALQTAMGGVFDVVTGLGNAFGAALRGDWAGAFDGLAQAADGAWTVIQEILGGIGGLVANLWDWTINVGVPAVTGWLADNAGDIGRGILAAAGWVVENIIVPIGTITLQIAGWLIESADSAWEAIKNWVLGRAGGVQGGGGAAGGALARATGSSIPIGPVGVIISDWIVSSAVSVWERIKQWVLGTGGGLSGGGRGAGGGLASAAREATGQGGIPIGAVAVQITEWPIVANTADIFNSITDWLDRSLVIDDAAAARWEPMGRDIGAKIMRAIIKGITSIFSGAGGVASGGMALGGSAGGAGGSEPHDWLWAYLGPILEGAWGELEPQLDAWGQTLKRSFEGWWNSFMPGIFEFSRDYTLEGGGFGAGAVLGGRSSNPFVRGIEDMFSGIYEDAQAAWDEFKGKFEGIFDDAISIPDINIDWPEMPEPPEWMTTEPQWAKNIREGRLPWDDGGDGGASLIEGGQRVEDTILQVRNALTSAIAAFGTSLSPSGGFGGPRTGPMQQFVDSIDPAALGAQIGAKLGTAMETARLTISTAAAGWGATLATGLATLGTTVGTAFAGVNLSISSAMLGAQMAVSLGAMTMNTALAAGLATMSATTASAFATIGAVTQGGMALATAAVVAGGARMAGAMTAAGAAMAGAATRAAATTASVLASGMAMASAAVQSQAGRWPGIIQAAGGAMAAAGNYAGRMAGMGVAAGLMSTLGAVQAAASAIINAVTGAMAAAALIASPSKITTYYGQMIGEGLIVGMRAMQPAVASQSASLMAMAQPAPYMGAIGGAGSYSSVSADTNMNVTVHVGGNVVGVDDLAGEVSRPIMEALATEARRHKTALGVS